MSQEKHHLGVGHRLQSPPTAAMSSAMNSELGYFHFVAEGLSLADIAHCLMLQEQGIIPRDAAKVLMAGLLELDQVPPDTWIQGLTEGDIYDHRDAWMKTHVGKLAGWLHTGRARREAITLGWLIGLRSDMHRLLESLYRFVDALALKSREHQATLMPDFTYLQHAHPTTLGHYLLGFAHPLLRDGTRLLHAGQCVSASPAGSVSTNGSRLNIDRERMRELLGFESLILHNRDAMWQPDLSIAIMGALVSLQTTIDRLAEELLIWATHEFGFVELADAHCRTSVIMPQKKNPYSLAHLRGKARAMTGQLVTVISTNQTPTGQVDNRTSAYKIVPQSVRETRESLDLLGEVITQASFDTARLAAAANEGGSWATELVEFLIETEKMDARTAHSLAGKMVADLRQERSPEALATTFQTTFATSTGKQWQGDEESLRSVFDPHKIVQARQNAGSCGPAAMQAILQDVQAHSTVGKASLAHAADTTGFKTALLDKAMQLLNDTPSL